MMLSLSVVGVALVGVMALAFTSDLGDVCIELFEQDLTDEEKEGAQ